MIPCRRVKNSLRGQTKFVAPAGQGIRRSALKLLRDFVPESPKPMPSAKIRCQIPCRREFRISPKGAPQINVDPALPTGAYVNECDYYQTDWQKAFWGPNCPRLSEIKRRYDPDDVFTVHHGVGSESWSPDGFTKVP
jgi:hypothetical protein